uniref:Uncharacterized protein AlNc14C2G365 n=1 Tax=Albugo laibachii Nc14 TaxID=890382 RepID=F0VZM7_9STRA|nr:conserved hypothetical protein [Albugo laibachii Nc14]|eukprot:CCA14257.1 conserved hypothetical protein [Albugo laibachii Nc14]
MIYCITSLFTLKETILFESELLLSLCDCDNLFVSDIQMNERCKKFWADNQLYMTQSQGKTPSDQQAIHSKMSKDLRTMLRFLQRNQTVRYTEGAQQKLVDTIALYNAYEKQLRNTHLSESTRLQGDLQHVIKDALAMPFTVFAFNHKKKLLKWHNESTIDKAEDKITTAEQVKWTVLDVEDDGCLILMRMDSGEIVESFSVATKSKQFQEIREGLDRGSVYVFTVDTLLLNRVEIEAE